MTDALFTEKTALKQAALQALAAIGDQSCVPTLIDRLEVSMVKERRDIIRTLRQLTGQGFGDNPEQWLRWWERLQEQETARR